MKGDAELRCCYDFMQRTFPSLTEETKEMVRNALGQLLPAAASVPLKKSHEAKLHSRETVLGDDLPRPRLPKSLRQLYGNSADAESRTMAFFHRVNEVDTFLNELEFQDCSYCHEGWFGTKRTKAQLPGKFETQTFQKTNFVQMPKKDWLEPERPICDMCLKEAKKRAQDGLPKQPFRLTAENFADPGDTLPETDALTFFEEELLSPIQHIVRIFTLHATGQCELRGHVGNLFQNGPQYVRQIPAVVGDMKMLLIRRCPKDPNRKQRVPFLVSRVRLEKALDRLCRPASAGGCLALQPGALTVEGYAELVNYDNLQQFSASDAGEEPEGLQVAVVEQQPWEYVEYKLFAMWVSARLELQLAALVRTLHEPEDVADDALRVEQTWSSLREAINTETEEAAGSKQEMSMVGLSAYMTLKSGKAQSDVENVLHESIDIETMNEFDARCHHLFRVTKALENHRCIACGHDRPVLEPLAIASSLSICPSCDEALQQELRNASSRENQTCSFPQCVALTALGIRVLHMFLWWNLIAKKRPSEWAPGNSRLIFKVRCLDKDDLLLHR